ncbi:hypothetical protein Pint_17822 [Pistacia integerrima]|uniref:Uncharacterized protein n=1 Tax=Pistacia integerrima TaxID=434235 RepID=A0ACC0YYZ0_9ROSI|nr:hypothetical protein Pint_17822 [Pistacia integerrima]
MNKFANSESSSNKTALEPLKISLNPSSSQKILPSLSPTNSSLFLRPP